MRTSSLAHRPAIRCSPPVSSVVSPKITVPPQPAALATAPDVLLMDEPFAAVDAQVREVLQEDLLALRDRLRQTIVFITHSIDETITLGDRIIVMGTRPGRIVRDVLVPIEQPRTIAQVRRHPAYTGLREEIWQQLRQSAVEQAGEA